MNRNHSDRDCKSNRVSIQLSCGQKNEIQNGIVKKHNPLFIKIRLLKACPISYVTHDGRMMPSWFSVPSC